jgi:hypothetical protein
MRMPTCRRLPMHLRARVADQTLDQDQGQPQPRLAVAAGVGRTGRLALGDAKRNQARHRGAARLIGVQYLRQKSPQGYAWRVSAFAVNYLQFVEHTEQSLLTQHFRKRKLWCLVEATPQLGDPAEKASVHHDGPPCRWVSEVIPF